MPADHAPAPPPSKISATALARGLAEQTGHTEATLMPNGRAALSALYGYLNLRREDEIYITTTFDYPNVSSCVTCTTFNFCKPSRVLTAHSKAILVIHEFGVPHRQTPKLRQEATRRGIPLIEDCAHSIASCSPEGWRVGEMSDWTIVSFPKIFPTAAGGALIGQKVADPACDRDSTAIAGAWWPLRSEHDRRRREVHEGLTRRFRNIGLKPLFEVTDRITPWFFPVPAPDPYGLMARARRGEVDCGLWHGTQIVVLPCHQFLTEQDLDRILEAVT